MESLKTVAAGIERRANGKKRSKTTNKATQTRQRNAARSRAARKAAKAPRTQEPDKKSDAGGTCGRTEPTRPLSRSRRDCLPRLDRLGPTVAWPRPSGLAAIANSRRAKCARGNVRTPA